MLIAEPTPKGAGIFLFGDLLDLSSLHETIHFLSDSALLGTPLSDFVLGLAYDVRKSYEGQREEKSFSRKETGEKVVYKGERILWPCFLLQLGLLRYSAGHHPTTRLVQAHLYQLEACAEKALLEYHVETGQKCLEWLSGFSGLPSKFLVEFINGQTRAYITTGKAGQARFKKLPALLRTLSPISEEYRRFDGIISTSAAQHACSPDELSDRSDWPDFEW
jgi:hypothetical protein